MLDNEGSPLPYKPYEASTIATPFTTIPQLLMQFAIWSYAFCSYFLPIVSCLLSG